MIPLEYLEKRLKKLQEKLLSNHDAFLITDPSNLFYMSGVENEDAFMLVTPMNAYYFTDKRYFMALQDDLVHLEVFCIDSSFVFEAFCVRREISEVFFEAHHMTLLRLDRLRKNNRKLKFTQANSLVLEFRHLKDAYELKQIERACQISKKAFTEIKKNFLNYKTEIEIAWEYERLIRQNKATGISFGSIIANGRSSSIPHYQPSNKRIDYTKLTLIDVGCRYNGYCSDMTRMIMPELDSVPNMKKQRQVHKIVRDAKSMAISMVKPGVKVKDIDQMVRSFFGEFGYAENFTHSLGHSVGINIHDGLVLSSSSETVLEKSMVITIEPGLYFDNDFGIRDEDIIIVK
jgi:Xaa-Pro aminopeptidase